MNNSPSVDDMLEAVIVAIQNELMPYLSNDKAMASAAMAQSVLQMARQVIPVRARTLREAAAHLTGVIGPEADRVRERAATLGQRGDLPPPVDLTEIDAAHRELSQALESTIADLDVLQRAGGDEATAANAALDRVRAHLAPRYLRDTMTITVGPASSAAVEPLSWPIYADVVQW